MPRYIATEGRNVRSYSTFEFVAANDEHAVAYLNTCLKADCIDWENVDPNSGEADCADPIIALDRLNPGSQARDEVDDQLLVPGVLYWSDATTFIRKVAALSEEGAYDNATNTLAALIEEAGALVAGHCEDRD